MHPKNILTQSKEETKVSLNIINNSELQWKFQNIIKNVTINGIYRDQALFRKYKTIVKNRVIAFAFIRGAQRDQYGALIYDLKSQYAREVNHYPDNLNAGLRLLSTHEKRKRPKEENKDKEKRDDTIEENHDNENDNEEMAFVQNGQKSPECFFCGGEHYLNKCPYCHQYKKNRLEAEKSKKEPSTTATSMFINDEET